MRKACLQSIYELALRDPRIVFVGSDLGAGTLEEFRREMPKRFFMEGISEAYVVGMAAGLARDGLIPYVNTIATFITRRALEQVAVDLCLQNLPVRLIGNGGGLVYAPLGPTHLATEDLALMRALPNMTVIAPTDAEEMRRCMAVTPDWPGPLYIRLAKGYDPVVSRPQDDFVIGRSILLRPPGEVLIVACGVMVQRALGAADLLRQRGIAAGVLNMHTLKPLDQETLRHWAPRVRALVTLEEHNRIGGLGSAVAECLVDAGVAPPLLRLGLPDAFPEHYGSQDSLLEHYGLQPAHIAHRIADCFPPPKRHPMSRLYSNLKFLAYPQHLEAIREHRMLAPVHIRVKPTNRCNHDCWYCAYHVDDLQLGADMDQRDTIPEAKMLEIADDMVAMGVQAVTFSGGGEPLIYKPLPRVIERLAAGGVRIASLTNGSNLKRTMADAFAAHGTWIRVSLDGWDEASYTRARRVPDGTFTHLLENMRAFAARGSRCTLGAAYIINQANHGHIYDICARLKEVGANHVKLSGVIVGNEPEENNRYHAGIKAEVGRQIERARTLEDDSFSVIDAFHDLEARIWHKPYHTCPFLMFQPVIGADCVVYTCHDKAYNQAGVLGSIRERSFRDFWFSEENGARFYGLDPSVTCRHHCTVHARNLAILEYLSLDPEHQAFV